MLIVNLIKLIVFVCNFLLINGVLNQYTDDQGRYIFDAPKSIINRKSRISNNLGNSNLTSPPLIRPNLNILKLNHTNSKQEALDQILKLFDVLNQTSRSESADLTSTTTASVISLEENSAESSSSVENSPPRKLSKQIILCARKCIVTNEYNPVCGTDGITYANMQKMICAQNCGQSVDIKRKGSCETFAPVPY